MLSARGAAIGGRDPDRTGTRSGKGLVIAFVMFLVAGLAPAVAGFAPLLPAANAQSGPAQDARGNPYSQTPSTCGAAERYSIEGRVFDDNGGGNWNWNPNLGDVGLGGQTVKLRYTATNSSGPVSEWYTTTTTADGSYCIRVADDFNPTALESFGSRILIPPTTTGRPNRRGKRHSTTSASSM